MSKFFNAQEMIELHSRLGVARCEFYLYNLDRGVTLRTAKRYNRVLEQFEIFLRKIPGSVINLLNFTISEVKAWVGERQEKPGYLSTEMGKSPSAVLFYEKVIVQYAKFASSMQLIEFNPMIGEVRYRLEERNLPATAESDVWSMLERVIGHTKGRLCVHLLFFEGLSPIEIVNLRIRDLVDIKGDLKPLITIRPRDIDDLKPRCCTISSDAQNLVRQYLSRTKGDRRGSVWLFPGRNPEAHVKRTALYYWIRELGKASGVLEVTAKKIRNAGLIYGKFGDDPKVASRAFHTVTERFNSPYNRDTENKAIEARKEVYKPRDQARLDRFIERFKGSNEEG